MNAIAEPNQTSRPQRVLALDWVRARPRLAFGGLAVVLLLAASAFGQPWLETLGVSSIILSLLPCAAMCAVGLCMKGGDGCEKQGGTDAKAKLNVPADTPDTSPPA